VARARLLASAAAARSISTVTSSSSIAIGDPGSSCRSATAPAQYVQHRQPALRAGRLVLIHGGRDDALRQPAGGGEHHRRLAQRGEHAGRPTMGAVQGLARIENAWAEIFADSLATLPAADRAALAAAVPALRSLGASLRARRGAGGN
jgi:hypothetical protein